MNYLYASDGRRQLNFNLLPVMLSLSLSLFKGSFASVTASTLADNVFTVRDTFRVRL
jgi:hypothetical protein